MIIRTCDGLGIKEMYVIPIWAIKFPVATREYLERFARREVDKKLFYYVKLQKLY